jgi:hypothetical protein
LTLSIKAVFSMEGAFNQHTSFHRYVLSHNP